MRYDRDNNIIMQQVDDACKEYPLCGGFIEELFHQYMDLYIKNAPDFVRPKTHEEISELADDIIFKVIYNVSRAL